MEGGDFGAFVDFDVGGVADAFDEVGGHAGSEFVADEHVDLAIAAAFGEEHDGLSGGVTRADDSDIGFVVEERFDAGADVIDALAFETFGVFGFEFSPADAGGGEDGVRADFCAAVEVEDVGFLWGGGGFEALDVDGGDHAGPELEHLEDAAGGEFHAGESGGEADEIFDTRGAADLSARSETIEDEGGESFGGGVDGGGDAGGTCADDGEVGILVGAGLPDSGGACEFVEEGVGERGAVVGEDGGESFGRAEGDGEALSFGRGGVVPVEGDEVFVEEFADEGGVFAVGVAEDLETGGPGFGEEFSALGEGIHDFFAEAGDAVEDFTEFGGGETEDACVAAGDAGDDGGSACEEVDVSGEFAGVMGGDEGVVGGGVEDVDGAFFDDEEVDSGLSGAEDEIAIVEFKGVGEGADGFDFIGGEAGEGERVGDVLHKGHPILGEGGRNSCDDCRMRGCGENNGEGEG